VNITEVRIKLMEDNNERLLAFSSITFDNMFVVRDLKIIEGSKGRFVAMPSRKLTDRCAHCGSKNHLRARFCNQCGTKLDEDRAIRDVDGRAKLHADIAHPVISEAREKIQTAILQAYKEEKERSTRPGYVCNYDREEELLGEWKQAFSDARTIASATAAVVRQDRGVTATQVPHSVNGSPVAAAKTGGAVGYRYLSEMVQIGPPLLDELGNELGAVELRAKDWQPLRQ
jgi:DNA-binding cell septation regulator SpoVG